MIKKLTIDPEFKNLIPPLSTDEYSQLEQNIINEGCRDKLVIWDSKIIDGHNRYEICHKNQVYFETKEMIFDERGEVIEWIIKNQFGRRNLPPYERTLLVLRLEGVLAERAKENQKLSEGRGAKGLTKSSKVFEPVNVRKEMAKTAGVSEDTISKVKVIEEKATPEQKEALRSGDVKINKVYREIKKREAEPPEAPQKKLSYKEINKIYEEMKNPPPVEESGNGSNEKFCNIIITELEEILNCFVIDINKYLFMEDILKCEPEIKPLLKTAMDDLRKINNFIKE